MAVICLNSLSLIAIFHILRSLAIKLSFMVELAKCMFMNLNIIWVGCYFLGMYLSSKEKPHKLPSNKAVLNFAYA